MPRRSQPPPLGYLVRAYLDEELVHYRPATQRGKRWMLRALARQLPDLPVPGDVSALLARKVKDGQLSPRTANNWLTALARVYRWAIDGGRWPGLSDITRHVHRFYHPPVKPRHLTHPELAYPRMLAAMPDALSRAFLSVQYRSALRVGEALALEREHLDFAAGLVRISQTREAGSLEVGPPKTRRSNRVVPLHQETAELLAEAAREKMADRAHWSFRGAAALRFLFPFSKRRLRQLLELLRRQGAGDWPGDGAWHVLRHTWTSRRADAGAQAHDLQRWLGHERLDSTSVYMSSLRRPEEDFGRLLELERRLEEKEAAAAAAARTFRPDGPAGLIVVSGPAPATTRQEPPHAEPRATSHEPVAGR